jgi:ribose transport system permease protein
MNYLEFNKNKLISLRTIAPLFFLIILLIIFGSLNPRFVSSTNFSTLLRQSSILLIISLASNFVILMGSIDLSVGATVTLAGVVAALLLGKVGMFVLIIGPLVGLLVGLLNGFICVIGKIPSFLTTLGTMSILTGVSLIISKGTPIPIRTSWFIDLANARILGNIANIFFWAMFMYFICIFIQFKTRFGRYIFAVGGNELVASLSGVPVKWVKIMTFMLAGLISGLAGVLLTSRIGSASTQMGEPFVMESIAAVVMGGTALTGGTGGIHRNILGVIVIAVLSNGMDVIGVHPYIQTLIKGMVIILSVAFSMDRSRIVIVK